MVIFWPKSFLLNNNNTDKLKLDKFKWRISSIFCIGPTSSLHQISTHFPTFFLPILKLMNNFFPMTLFPASLICGLFAWLLLRQKGTCSLTRKDTKRDNMFCTISLCTFSAKFMHQWSRLCTHLLWSWFGLPKTCLQNVCVHACMETCTYASVCVCEQVQFCGWKRANLNLSSMKVPALWISSIPWLIRINLNLHGTSN